MGVVCAVVGYLRRSVGKGHQLVPSLLLGPQEKVPVFEERFRSVPEASSAETLRRLEKRIRRKTSAAWRVLESRDEEDLDVADGSAYACVTIRRQ